MVSSSPSSISLNRFSIHVVFAGSHSIHLLTTLTLKHHNNSRRDKSFSLSLSLIEQINISSYLRLSINYAHLGVVSTLLFKNLHIKPRLSLVLAWKMNGNYHEKYQLNAIIFTQSAHFPRDFDSIHQQFFNRAPAHSFCVVVRCCSWCWWLWLVVLARSPLCAPLSPIIWFNSSLRFPAQSREFHSLIRLISKALLSVFIIAFKCPPKTFYDFWNTLERYHSFWWWPTTHYPTTRKASLWIFLTLSDNLIFLLVGFSDN